METPDVNKAILVLHLESIDDIQNPQHLGLAIARASERTRMHLRILILSQIFNKELREKPAHYWHPIHNFLSYVYEEATRPAHAADRILTNVEVIFRDPTDERSFEKMLEIDWDHLYTNSPNNLPKALQRLPKTALACSTATTKAVEGLSLMTDVEGSYPVVALGGTFDHLHAGHKILLSMSAWIATQKVIVGVTDDALLVNKSNRDVMEPLSERIENVCRFLELFKPGLINYVVPIQDIYGPTGWDPNVQALVVSKETFSGAEAVKKKREEESLPLLQNFVIDVISPSAAKIVSGDAHHLKTAKMSSTFVRQWIVEKRKDSSVSDVFEKARSMSPEPAIPGAFPL